MTRILIADSYGKLTLTKKELEDIMKQEYERGYQDDVKNTKIITSTPISVYWKDNVAYTDNKTPINSNESINLSNKIENILKGE